MLNNNPGKINAQASIDMLIAYGIAILIIAVAIYVVLQSGILNARIIPDYCDSVSPFACSSYSMSTNGVLTMVLAQASGVTINVTGVACASTSNSLGTLGPAYGNVNLLSYRGAPQFYPNNQLEYGLLLYSDNQTELKIYCYRGTGIATGGLGNPYTGLVWISYTMPSLPGHTVQQIATFTTKYT